MEQGINQPELSLGSSSLWVDVVYENFPAFCNSCKSVVHAFYDCKRNIKPNHVEKLKEIPLVKEHPMKKRKPRTTLHTIPIQQTQHALQPTTEVVHKTQLVSIGVAKDTVATETVVVVDQTEIPTMNDAIQPPLELALVLETATQNIADD